MNSSNKLTQYLLAHNTCVVKITLLVKKVVQCILKEYSAGLFDIVQVMYAHDILRCLSIHDLANKCFFQLLLLPPRKRVMTTMMVRDSLSTDFNKLLLDSCFSGFTPLCSVVTLRSFLQSILMISPEFIGDVTLRILNLSPYRK